MAESVKSDIELLLLYNEVDAYLRLQYKQDKYADHSFLIQELSRTNRTIARFQQDMRAIVQLRNSIVHNPFSSAQPIAMPHPIVVKRYKDIRDALLNPQSALSISVPAAKIYTVELSFNLNEVLRKMDENIYTHVPVIKDNKMVGMLSENTLLSYLAESGEAIITKDMTVADLSEFTPFKAHRNESFVFLPRKASLSKVFEVFGKAIRVHERIGMVFITESGKDYEKPLGIITAWDLASPEFVL